MNNRVEYTIEKLKTGGIFLSAGDNVMTIGWGQFGVMWGKNVFIAAIRPSRYSDSIVKKIGEFALSVPFANTFVKELAFVGKNSGQNVDKWEECSLNKIKANAVNANIVGDCKHYFECRVLSALTLTQSQISEEDMRWYPQLDFHNLYISEIIESY